MPKSITMPAGNTQTSQRKNALPIGATDTPAHKPTQAELQNQIDSLNGDIYDNLTLHSSHLEMLFKMVRTAIDDLTNDNAPHHAISQAKQSLLIAQYLIDEFDYCIQSMIEAHPLYKAEGKV